MAFPRYAHGLWKDLADKINAIGDYFEVLAATMTGRVKNSVENDPDDGKAQLVNDLTEAELIPNLVYGTDEDGVRGWKTTGETPHYQKHTVTSGEVITGIITLTGGETYVLSNNSLMVFLQGQLQTITDDYAETDTTTVTFVPGWLTINDTIIFRWQK